VRSSPRAYAQGGDDDVCPPTSPIHVPGPRSHVQRRRGARLLDLVSRPPRRPTSPAQARASCSGVAAPRERFPLSRACVAGSTSCTPTRAGLLSAPCTVSGAHGSSAGNRVVPFLVPWLDTRSLVGSLWSGSCRRAAPRRRPPAAFPSDSALDRVLFAASQTRRLPFSPTGSSAIAGGGTQAWEAVCFKVASTIKILSRRLRDRPTPCGLSGESSSFQHCARVSAQRLSSFSLELLILLGPTSSEVDAPLPPVAPRRFGLCTATCHPGLQDSHTSAPTSRWGQCLVDPWLTQSSSMRWSRASSPAASFVDSRLSNELVRVFAISCAGHPLAAASTARRCPRYDVALPPTATYCSRRPQKSGHRASSAARACLMLRAVHISIPDLGRHTRGDI